MVLLLVNLGLLSDPDSHSDAGWAEMVQDASARCLEPLEPG